MLEYRNTARAFGEFLDANVYKVGYLIGTRGQTITQSMINYRLSSESYKRYWPTISEYAKKWLVNNPYDGGPWVVADCLGWLEMFWNGGWYDRPVTKSTYPDTTTGLVYKLVQIEGLPNGSIETIPKNCPYPIAVGYSGHVGFYYKGLVYQSAGHKSGTIRSTLTNTEHNKAWQYWYMIPYLDYLGWKGTDEDVLKRGDKGYAVGAWQRSLIDWDAGALPEYRDDSSFGPETEVWTNKFKSFAGMIADGAVDDVTWGTMSDYLRTHSDEAILRAEIEGLKKANEILANKLEVAEADVERKESELQDVADSFRAIKATADKHPATGAE